MMHLNFKKLSFLLLLLVHVFRTTIAVINLNRGERTGCGHDKHCVDFCVENHSDHLIPKCYAHRCFCTTWNSQLNGVYRDKWVAPSTTLTTIYDDEPEWEETHYSFGQTTKDIEGSGSEVTETSVTPDTKSGPRSALTVKRLKTPDVTPEPEEENANEDKEMDYKLVNGTVNFKATDTPVAVIRGKWQTSVLKNLTISQPPASVEEPDEQEERVFKFVEGSGMGKP
ncbi:unnamed protein product [Caenorhabditis brenneri]